MEHYCLKQQVKGCYDCRHYSMDTECVQDIMNKDDDLDNYN